MLTIFLQFGTLENEQHSNKFNCEISEKALNYYLIQTEIVNSNTLLSPCWATIVFDFLMALYLGTIVPI